MRLPDRDKGYERIREPRERGLGPGRIPYADRGKQPHSGPVKWIVRNGQPVQKSAVKPKTVKRFSDDQDGPPPWDVT